MDVEATMCGYDLACMDFSKNQRGRGYSNRLCLNHTHIDDEKLQELAVKGLFVKYRRCRRRPGIYIDKQLILQR